MKQAFWITAVYSLLLLMNIGLPKGGSWSNEPIEQRIEHVAFGASIATFKLLEEELHDPKNLSLYPAQKQQSEKPTSLR